MTTKAISLNKIYLLYIQTESWYQLLRYFFLPWYMVKVKQDIILRHFFQKHWVKIQRNPLACNINIPNHKWLNKPSRNTSCSLLKMKRFHTTAECKIWTAKTKFQRGSCYSYYLKSKTIFVTEFYTLLPSSLGATCLQFSQTTQAFKIFARTGICHIQSHFTGQSKLCGQAQNQMKQKSVLLLWWRLQVTRQRM